MIQFRQSSNTDRFVFSPDGCRTVVLGFLALGLLMLAASDCFAASIEYLASAKQLVVVVSEDWSTVPATLARYERKNANSVWRKVGESAAVVVGRNGMGWATDAAAPTKSAGPLKKEGDGKSPAGVFRLGFAFGLASAKQTKPLKVPYVALSDHVECVDDIESSHYNLVVDRNKMAKPDWNSSEKMKQIGEQYRLGVFVEHNTAPTKPGAGSCIFLHIWKDSHTGTSGCTAMASANMERLVTWLDAKKNPVLVQLPVTLFRQLQSQWELPAVPK